VSGLRIPDAPWFFMSEAGHEHRARVHSLWLSLEAKERGSGEEMEGYRRHSALGRRQHEASRELERQARCAWGSACELGGDVLVRCLDHHAASAADALYQSRDEASRHLTLIMWYMVAVYPWWHLAQLGGLATDDASFIAWAGRDAGTREALEFLGSAGTLTALGNVQATQREPGPGRVLGAFAAAYSGVVPSGVRRYIATVLETFADDHMLTRPMADLLLRLDPKCLDAVFGPDVAMEIDQEFGLAPGTAGLVTRALADRLGETRGLTLLRRAADRSAQALPVVNYPGYEGSYGQPYVLAARVVAASLAQAGLAKSDWHTADESVAKIHALWTPRKDQRT
jgi:hypothetical protein